MLENTDQNNSEYGHFLRSESFTSRNETESPSNLDIFLAFPKFLTLTINF